jgi:hypothetical protein
VNGDPVGLVDPLGLGNWLSDAWNTVNPLSSSNYFRQSAENGGTAATIVRYVDPAYLAVSGYVGAYDAWENGCPLSTVLGNAALGTVGALGTVAFGYDAVLFGRGIAEGWNAAQGGLRSFSDGSLSIGDKAGQIAQRGWTEQSIEETVANPVETHEVWDVAGGAGREPATAYVNSDGTYVVVNDETGRVVQISDANRPGWKPVWDDPRFRR